MKNTRKTRLTSFAACFIVFFTALLSSCLPRSKHPSHEGETILLGTVAGQSGTVVAAGRTIVPATTGRSDKEAAAERSCVAVADGQSGTGMRPAYRDSPTRAGAPARVRRE